MPQKGILTVGDGWSKILNIPPSNPAVKVTGVMAICSLVMVGERGVTSTPTVLLQESVPIQEVTIKNVMERAGAFWNNENKHH